MLVTIAAACQPVKSGPPPPATPNAPVFDRDFPDPAVVAGGPTGGYYAFSTNNPLFGNVPVATSTDLAGWSGALLDALPLRPVWATSEPNRVWAPAVYQFGPTYVLYFTAPHVSGYQCIGAAVSVLPGGPYVSAGLVRVVCQTSLGGSIDPSVFVDAGGTPWLLWKSDGNCCGVPPQIWSARLNPTGLAVDGAAHALIGVDQGWEQGGQPFQRVVEGPAMVQAGGTHYLFYAGNWWESANYAIGYASCASPAGPCGKPQAGPVMVSGPLGAGPGGAEVVTDGNGTRWLAYHAWAPGQVGYACCGGSRSLRFSQVTLNGGSPAFGGSPPAAATGPDLLPIGATTPAPCGVPTASPGSLPSVGADKPVVEAPGATELDTGGLVPTLVAAG